MDSKLKALKVVDLKSILADANVSFPAKANKQDLIARIIASQPATQIYYKLHPPPQPVQQDPTPVPHVEQVVPKDVPLPTTSTNDSEAQKRSQRAARFGIPVIEPLKPAAPTSAKTLPDDPEKLKARAARFGTQHVIGDASLGQKRSAPPEHIDVEEAERRRKRAERFGLTSVVGLVPA